MTKTSRGNRAKKVKDPYAIRRERDRGKIFNKKPTDNEDEFVPKKVQDVVKLSNGIVEGFKNRKRAPKKRTKDGGITSRGFVQCVTPEKGMTKPLKPIPLFEQGPSESDRKFLKRVEKLTKERLQQSRFEDKYKVDIIPDPVTGERKMVDREERKKGARKKKKLLDEDGQEMPKKINRKKLAKLKRKQKLAEKQDDFAHLKDRVEFGDVVQKPPDIKAAPRKATSDSGSTKPGRKSLLLKKLFTDAQAGARPSSAPKSLHQKAALEEERLKAVAAYRQLKQQKIERSAKS